ncbi:DUF2848 domain-containing protein [Chitinasiproducens palmae]|uniref:DUF2848 domain-containing protein n=1 Tax=Chitinasiproducens palmae TaxID=1770053 RepID=A0A1H2PRB5_9BURK|nr:DUF2848 domain-containing protein [Chitinasiproducens palmae]SDV49007.1 Protein of unknown function [Chitinasiproducens palmae]
MPTLTFHVADGATLNFSPKALVIAGWAGRDAASVEHHIRELEAIGVKRPSTVPCFYPLAPALLSTDATLSVPRSDSSGEVECVLLATEQGLMVGIGSDHTDRRVEAYDVTVSKQMCGKPVSDTVWRFDEVADHWDSLEMRCWRVRGGDRALYQSGSTASLRDPRELIERFTGASTLPVGTVMYCGTQAVIGELGHGDAFEVELHDPVRSRTLKHVYSVEALPVSE